MEVDPLAARQAQSARALAYWGSRAEADRNGEAMRDPCGRRRSRTPPPTRYARFQKSFRASVEVLKPGDAAYGAVLGVDTAPPDSDAAAALVACGQIVKIAQPPGSRVDVLKMAEEKEKDPASDALRRVLGTACETRDATSAHIPSGASLPLRVAALRAQLRAELGAETFGAAYQSLDSMDESVDAAPSGRPGEAARVRCRRARASAQAARVGGRDARTRTTTGKDAREGWEVGEPFVSGVVREGKQYNSFQKPYGGLLDRHP